ncbi:eIF-3 beta [Reticulomyxa filosa]|uniref:eIF-3 beta n=1 Tax=Reticulomyxa filosa TaxID=46433 RepID=X6NSL7_RETFI|nr:eIF-3 beta [Reticulomyxa filosa]|eukprot:ETO28312.1 eIF-3 beta [Reticulomyxa filosa]
MLGRHCSHISRNGRLGWDFHLCASSGLKLPYGRHSRLFRRSDSVKLFCTEASSNSNSNPNPSAGTSAKNEIEKNTTKEEPNLKRTPQKGSRKGKRVFVCFCNVLQMLKRTFYLIKFFVSTHAMKMNTDMHMLCIENVYWQRMQSIKESAAIFQKKKLFMCRKKKSKNEKKRLETEEKQKTLLAVVTASDAKEAKDEKETKEVKKDQTSVETNDTQSTDTLQLLAHRLKDIKQQLASLKQQKSSNVSHTPPKHDSSSSSESTTIATITPTPTPESEPKPTGTDKAVPPQAQTQVQMQAQETQTPISKDKVLTAEDIQRLQDWYDALCKNYQILQHQEELTRSLELVCTSVCVTLTHPHIWAAMDDLLNYYFTNSKFKKKKKNERI